MNTTITVGTKVRINKPELANNPIDRRGGHSKVGTVKEITPGGSYLVSLGHSNQQFWCSLEQLTSHNG
jgi:hypothetical protein